MYKCLKKLIQVKEDEIGRACSACGENSNTYSIFMGEPEGNTPLGRPRGRWENNSKMNLREEECSFMEWIHLVQDRDHLRAL
jgi:hypothetical protein